MEAQSLRQSLKTTQSADMRRRRAIIATSLAGLASMSVVSLFQSGMLKHLPELPLPGFDSDKVNDAAAAYRWGVPDAALATMGCALNFPLATWGGNNRAEQQPYVPLLAAAKGALDAAIATRYLYEMPVHRGAWSSYSIIAALVDFTVFGLTLPEAGRALSALRRR